MRRHHIRAAKRFSPRNAQTRLRHTEDEPQQGGLDGFRGPDSVSPAINVESSG